jgi:phosphatidylserine/phosphatidylglycerophosphate/cardiolipin synthase-like enzyme
MDEIKLGIIISELVQVTPLEIIQEVLEELELEDSTPSDILRSRLYASIQSPDVKSRIIKLIDCWEQDYPQISSRGIALAMRSSMITLTINKPTSVELVWSGPDIPYPLRRTDQAMLELINDAKYRLVLVSFAVYRAQGIIDAIKNAIRRNVEVIICLEDTEEGQEKITFSGFEAFESNIFRLASFYCWPIENRPQIGEGKFGSLHAKVAVADRQRAFISSANLTEYAMNLNIEVGVLVTGDDIPAQVDKLFEDLILSGVLKRVNPWSNGDGKVDNGIVIIYPG